MRPLIHPRPPGPHCCHAALFLHRLNVQMTMLEHGRTYAVEPVRKDMDSKAVLWRRCEAEWVATLDFLESVGRPW